MPYRRLPNTDSARLRAMEKALKIADNIPPYQLAYSVSTFQKLKYFYPEFHQAIIIQKETLERQTEKSKNHSEYLKKARLYISHFIQVVNFSIIRGELKPDTRKYYKLDEYDKKLPNLNTEPEIAKWGKIIIDGEQQRLAMGQSAITNPTIARVKVHYEEFQRAHKNQKYLQDANNNALKKVAELRTKADSIIVDLWNEIEETYAKLPGEEKRQKATKYGIAYVYRKNEKLAFSNLKLLNL